MRDAALAQAFGEPRHLRGLAHTLDPFDRQEASRNGAHRAPLLRRPAALVRDIGGHRRIVLLERRGKYVAAIALRRGDEIKGIGFFRMRGRTNHRGARQGDGRGRQTRRAYRCCRAHRCAGPPCECRRHSGRPSHRSPWDRPAAACRWRADADTGRRSSASSCGRPLSFSTIEAMINSSSASCSGRPGSRSVQAASSSRCERGMRLAQQLDVGGAADEAIGLRQKLAFRHRCPDSPSFSMRSGAPSAPSVAGRRRDCAARRSSRSCHPPAIDDGERVQQHLAVHHFRQQLARRRARARSRIRPP